MDESIFEQTGNIESYTADDDSTGNVSYPLDRVRCTRLKVNILSNDNNEPS